MTLANKVTQFISDSDIIHQIVHGDANTTVETEGGAVRSLAKVVADKDAQFVAGAVVQQANDAAARAEAAAGSAAASVAGLHFAVRKALAKRISDAAISDVRLVQFEIESDSTINRISGYVGATDTSGAKLVEIAIYDATFAKLVSSEVREIPAVGDFQFAIPETLLARGRYFFGICTNSATAQFGVNPYAGALSATAAFPAPALAASPVATAIAPAVTVLSKDLPAVQGLFLHATSTVRVYGVDTVTSQPYGWNTATGHICKSVDSGATFTDLMPLPNTGADTINDLIVEGGKIYVFTSGCTLFVSSDLTAAATWADISCPTMPGLRHAQAVGRPYGICAFGGYVFIGEYTNAPNEFAPDGPRVLRYKIADGTWALSKEFAGARHIHSFTTPGASKLWVSCGDAAYGSAVGIHRLTPANIGTGPGGSDVWTQWTSLTAPNTDHYPVDFIDSNAFSYRGETAPAGLYGASDRPGKHLLYSKPAGAAGKFNLSAQIFRRTGGPDTETVRSLVQDPTNGNLYYWTAETTEQALYVSPPPYTQEFKLKDYPALPKLFLSRAVYSGGFVMMFDQRFRVEKFIGQ